MVSNSIMAETLSPQSKKSFSFFDVLKFAAGYWFQQPWKLTIIISLLIAASVTEAYLSRHSIHRS